MYSHFKSDFLNKHQFEMNVLRDVWKYRVSLFSETQILNAYNYLKKMEEVLPINSNLNKETLESKFNTFTALNNISNTLNGFTVSMEPEINIKYTSQIQNFGEWLYGGASLALIVISIILLLAMVAPIFISRSSNNHLFLKKDEK